MLESWIWRGAPNQTTLVAWMVQNLPARQQTQVQSLGWEDSLEKAMATHSSFLAWRIPWTEEPGGLHSTGSQRAGHHQVTNTQSQAPAQHQPGWGCMTLGALPSPAPALSGRSLLLTLLQPLWLPFHFLKLMSSPPTLHLRAFARATPSAWNTLLPTTPKASYLSGL